MTRRPTYPFVLSALLCAVFTLALSGCGTTVNSSSFSSSGSATAAQSQPAAGPTLGYVWDPVGQAISPIHGLPGASVVGSPVVSASGQGYVAAASSSVSGTAVFLDGKGNIFQGQLSGGPLSKIASAPGATSLVLANAGGYALVIGKNGTGTAIASVVSGLPGAPSTRALNLAGVATISGGAVSDTGTVALAGASNSGVSILAFVGQGAGTQVATAGGFGGMQFVPGSDELVFADGASGQVSAISHVNTAPSSAVVSAAGGIGAPASLDITPNGRWAVAANHSGDVLRVDLTGTAGAAKTHCACAPTQVLALNGSASSGSGAGTTLRLVTSGGGPLWIVDAGGGAPRVLFVPVSTPANAATVAPKNIAKSAM